MPAKAVGLCHGFRLKHRVRQQAGSYGSVSCVDVSADATNVGVLPWDFGQRKTRCRSAHARDGGGSVPWIRLIHRVRQQAGSYGSVSCLDISADATDVGVLPRDFGQRKTGVGARLPAKAVGLCHGFRLTQRVRQQAGSYGSVSCLDIGRRKPMSVSCLEIPANAKPV